MARRNNYLAVFDVAGQLLTPPQSHIAGILARGKREVVAHVMPFRVVMQSVGFFQRVSIHEDAPVDDPDAVARHAHDAFDKMLSGLLGLVSGARKLEHDDVAAPDFAIREGAPDQPLLEGETEFVA